MCLVTFTSQGKKSIIIHNFKKSQSLPCAVEVVLTLAAASGHRGGIEPESRSAVPVPTPLISIITVRQQSTASLHQINISMWKGTYCHTMCSTSYLSLYNWWPGNCLAQRRIIIMYWLGPLLTKAPQRCEAVCMKTYHREGLLSYIGTTSSACQHFQSKHHLHLAQQGKQMPILIMVMTVINEWIN